MLLYLCYKVFSNLTFHGTEIGNRSNPNTHITIRWRINLLNKVDVVSSLLSGISPLIFEVTFFMKFIFFSLRNVIMSNENFQVSNLVLSFKKK